MHKGSWYPCASGQLRPHMSPSEEETDCQLDWLSTIGKERIRDYNRCNTDYVKHYNNESIYLSANLKGTNVPLRASNELTYGIK